MTWDTWQHLMKEFAWLIGDVILHETIIHSQHVTELHKEIKLDCRRSKTVGPGTQEKIKWNVANCSPCTPSQVNTVCTVSVFKIVWILILHKCRIVPIVFFHRITQPRNSVVLCYIFISPRDVFIDSPKQRAKQMGGSVLHSLLDPSYANLIRYIYCR